MKPKIGIFIIALIMVLSTLVVMPIGIENAKAETWTQTLDTDFETGTLENLEIVGTSDGAKLRLETKNELGVWHEQQLTPSARRCHALTYDSINNKVVLFGGRDPSIEVDDTWVYDVACDTWTEMSPTTIPSVRQGHALAYDSLNNKVVLFGGVAASRNDETWVYDVASDTWTQMNPSTKPSARERHGMAFDSLNNKVVLFGGIDSGGFDDQTWVYDVASDSWTQMSPATSPSARGNHTMDYDSANKKIVLFGGEDGSLDDETWTYDVASDNWTQMSPSTSPSARQFHNMVYDSVDKKMVLFGGNDGNRDDETWIYDLLSDTWTQMSPATSPSAREKHKMAYDSANNKVVLFGGYDSGGWDWETWVYDLENDLWTQKCQTTKPSARDKHRMAYDSLNENVVLFGGDDGSLDNETWVYDVASDEWTEMSPTASPSPREGHAMIYDSANNKVVLFGGEDAGGRDSETWTYDLSADTWTQKSPGTNPTARDDHAMAYDSANNKIVLFGGYDASGRDDETWTYDLASDTWTNMNPSSEPSARYKHAMTYDSANNRVVLFGGEDAVGNSGQTWAYESAANTWTLKDPVINPPGRNNHSMVYDSVNSKIVLFGGYNTTHYDDIWVYDLAIDNWTERNPPTKPSARSDHAITYDSTNNKVVLFGGNDGSLDNETWLFNINNYYNAGTYTSGVYTYDICKLERITWKTNNDPDGFVRFQVAVSEDGTDWDYLGPDGTSSTFYDEVTGGDLWEGYSGQYFRYRAYFTTQYAGNTPSLSEVSITYTTPKEPTVTLTCPNGGEDWMKGAYYPITWVAEGDFNSTPVCLYYSTDNGANWTSIVNWTANSGYYNWTVPSITTPSGLIKVSVTDIYEDEVNDTSDASFAIDPPPPISGGITSPSAGTIWGEGEHSILWNINTIVNSISLEYTLDGEIWTKIGSDLPNTNSYSWDIPGGENSKSARIRLKALDNSENILTFSSGIFTIDTELPSISHEQVTKGTVGSAITFEAIASDNFEVSSVALYCNENSGFVPISMNKESGIYSASIVPTKEGTLEYYLEVSDGANYVSTEIYQVDIIPPEDIEVSNESSYDWFVGAVLLSSLVYCIGIGLVIRGIYRRGKTGD